MITSLLEITSLEQQIVTQQKALQFNKQAFKIAQEKLQLENITFIQFLEARDKRRCAENEMVLSKMQLQLNYRILGFVLGMRIVMNVDSLLQ